MTRADLIRQILRETRLGEYGTATGGSTSTIVDTTKLKSDQFNDTDFVGQWARIEYDAGGAAAAPEGEIRPITAFAPSTGTLTVSPEFSAAPASTDKYQTFRIHPQIILDFIDQVVAQDAWVPCWTILTEVPDGDMEQSGVTEWTASNATVTKVSTEPAMMGSRWLSVATTSAGGYAQSATWRVRPSEKYHLSALVRANAASTTAKLIAWDVTNGAEIDSKTTTRQDVNRLWFEFTAPATCDQVAVRVANVENTVTTLWDEVCGYALNSASIRLPWWVKSSAQVKGVFRLSPDTTGTDLWTAELRGERDNGWDVADSWNGGSLALTSRHGTGLSQPLFIKGVRNETAFANENTEVKHLDAKWTVALVAYRLFESLAGAPDMGPPELNSWLGVQYKKWAEKFMAENKAMQYRLEQETSSYNPDAAYYRSAVDASVAWRVR